MFFLSAKPEPAKPASATIQAPNPAEAERLTAEVAKQVCFNFEPRMDIFPVANDD